MAVERSNSETTQPAEQQAAATESASPAEQSGQQHNAADAN
jgi:hypothetical protein